MSDHALSLHGRVLSTGLVGLAALATQAVAPDVAAAAPALVGGFKLISVKKAFDSGTGTPYAGSETGVYVAAGAVTPPGGTKHSEVFVGNGPGTDNISYRIKFRPELTRFDTDTTGSEDFASVGPPQSGVRVAVGDVNGDGILDVFGGAATGTSSFLRDSITIKFPNVYNYPQQNGIYVAAGDVTGDGRADVVVGPSKGDDSSAPALSPVVKTYAYADADGAMIPGTSFTPFAGTGYAGGVRVAAGDVDGDGQAEIVVGADQGTNPSLRLVNVKQKSWERVGADSHGSDQGVYIAVGDVDGDGLADLVTAPGPGGAPIVDIYTYDPNLGGAGVGGFAFSFNFAAFAPGYLGGVSVAVGDFDGDGTNDILTSQVGAVPEPASSALLMVAGAKMLGRRRVRRPRPGS